jgi:hypothetical protein
MALLRSLRQVFRVAINKMMEKIGKSFEIAVKKCQKVRGLSQKGKGKITQSSEA